jgi:CRP-like cAMP-binding protein
MHNVNLLLAALPQDALERLSRFSRPVELALGEVISRPGEVIEYVHFPLTCLISITVTMDDGRTSEAGLVGNREMVGLNAFMGGSESSQTEYITQSPGQAIRIAAEPFLAEFDQNKSVRDVMLRFTQAYVAQLSQNVACNRRHEVPARLARWLMECYQRLQTNDLSITHEFISQMLGVRRAGVTEAAIGLKRIGAIDHSRNSLRITNLELLRGEACECFETLRKEYSRLLQFP